MEKLAFVIVLLLFAVGLWVVSSRDYIRNHTLDRLNKVAAIMSFFVALAMLVYPLGSTSETFSYQIQVRDKETGNDVPGADIRIEVGGGIAPLQGVTDSSGFTRFFIGMSYVGKPGRLIIDANGYKRHDLNINLREDELPFTVQIEPKLLD